MGCFFSSKIKDYSGKKINLDKYPFAIISYQQDTFNEDIYYITYKTIEISSSYQDDIDSKEEKVMAMKNKFEQTMAQEENLNKTATDESDSDSEIESEEETESEQEPEDSSDESDTVEDEETSKEDKKNKKTERWYGYVSSFWEG